MAQWELHTVNFNIMAITKFERWKTSEKNSDDRAKLEQDARDKPIYEDENLATRMLYDKVHELTDLINEHITKMAANDAKSSFPGFGTSNSTALRGDTTVISSSQAKDITNTKTDVANNATTIKSIDTQVSTNKTNIATNVTNIDSKLTKMLGKNQSLVCSVEEDKNGDHTLVFMLSIKDEKSGKTIRKTATLQLK